MILSNIELYNFMIFNGKHNFKLSNNVNLIVGKNESGKSILSIDSFKYVFLKRIRYKKLENVINNKIDGNEYGYVHITSKVDDIDMGFKRYLKHPKFKNNLAIFNNVISTDSTDSIIIDDLESFANVKNVSINNFLKNLNVFLDYFDLVSVYNPTKDIMAEKKSILELLSVNFNSIISMFDNIYRMFDSEVMHIQNEVDNLESQLNSLTKSYVISDEVDKLRNENSRIKTKILEFKGNKGQLSDALEKLSSYSGELTNKISQNEKEIVKLKSFYKSGVCNTCKRPFDTDDQKNTLKLDMRKYSDECQDANNKLAQIVSRISQIKQSIQKIDSNIWTLNDKSKENDKKLNCSNTKIDTIKNLATDKRKQLTNVEDKILKFKRIYESVFSSENVNLYIRNKINSFEQLYEDIYNTLTQQNVCVKLNINKYEEPEFGDFIYSGLSTSKKRITYLVMMLALHNFCDTKLDFLILDEFFDVFDFENMIKTLEIIFSDSYFNKLQFVITSNNDDLIGLLKNKPLNLINLIDYTKN